MRAACYLHVYCTGPWREVVTEICDALAGAGLHREIGHLRVGVIGELHNQAAALALVDRYLPAHLVAYTATGWEQETLDALHTDARAGIWDAAAYLHTKGVSDPSAWNDAWRAAMLAATVTNWRRCLELLEHADTVGCHWLTPAAHPRTVTHPYYGGNYWWTTARYAATLHPPLRTNRYYAEAWIGTGQPRVIDLAPGWPAPETLYSAAGGDQPSGICASA